MVLWVSVEFDCVSAVHKELITSLYKVPRSLKKTKEDNGWIGQPSKPKSIRKPTKIATFLELICIISFHEQSLKRRLYLCSTNLNGYHSSHFVGKPCELRMCTTHNFSRWNYSLSKVFEWFSDCRLVNWLTYLKNETPSGRLIVSKVDRHPSKKNVFIRSAPSFSRQISASQICPELTIWNLMNLTTDRNSSLCLVYKPTSRKDRDPNWHAGNHEFKLNAAIDQRVS